MKKLKHSKFIITIASVLVLVMIGFFFLRSKAVGTLDEVGQRRTEIVQKGTLSITLAGSGSVSANQRKEIQSQVTGFVSESFLVDGKAVKAGDVLVKLESRDAEINLKKMENALKQKELAANQQNDQLNNLLVNASISGRITGLTLKEGEPVNKGQIICSISDESYLQIRVQFLNTSVNQLNQSKEAKLHIEEYTATLNASIEAVVQSGADTEVLLMIKNPGALVSGIHAIAEITNSNGNYISETGTLEWRSQEVIKAASSGIIKNITALDNQNVNKGKTILMIENDELPIAVDSTLLDLEKARYDYEQAKFDMDKYTITAPFDGILVSATDLVAGDSVKPGTSLGVLLDTSMMNVSVNIDELDISKIKPGQDVAITVEALEETIINPIMGQVSAVAVEGTSTNGVSSYPVTITFPGRAELKVGMNVDAIIQVLNKKDTLLVPIEAVQKQGNDYFVWIEGVDKPTSTIGISEPDSDGRRNSGAQRQQTPEQQERFQNMSDEERQAAREQLRQRNSTAGQGTGAADGTLNNTASKTGSNVQGSYYAGAVRVKVKVGEHNENYIEIVDGIKEGDVVVLPQKTVNPSTSETSNSRQNFNMMPSIPSGNMGGRRGGN